MCSKMPMQLLVAKKPYNNITIIYYAFLHAYIVCVHCTALSDLVYVVFLYGTPAHLVPVANGLVKMPACNMSMCECKYGCSYMYICTCTYMYMYDTLLHCV